MLKAVIAIIGMLATGFIVWKLLERQGNATDAKGNIIGRDGAGGQPTETSGRDVDR